MSSEEGQTTKVTDESTPSIDATTDGINYDTVALQMTAIVDFINGRLAEYNEMKKNNALAVLMVNYVQNKYVASMLCPEIGKLFRDLKVTKFSDFNKVLTQLEANPEMRNSVKLFKEAVSTWDNFLQQVDKELDTTVGPVPKKSNNSNQEPPEKTENTVSHYVNKSTMPYILIVVVRSFNRQEVNNHILNMYKHCDELDINKIDVYLLTRGPKFGERGGSYIKLIGLPFRRINAASEAEGELKKSRKSAISCAGWRSLNEIVQFSLVDQKPKNSDAGKVNELSDPFEQITNLGGTLLLNKNGDILYRVPEFDDLAYLPSVTEIIRIVKENTEREAEEKAALDNNKDIKDNNANEINSKINGAKLGKIDSEVSMGKVSSEDVKKNTSCCVIC